MKLNIDRGTVHLDVGFFAVRFIGYVSDLIAFRTVHGICGEGKSVIVQFFC